MGKKILRRQQVQERTGLPTSTLYREMNEGRFPRPVRISTQTVGWYEDEVLEWIENRPRSDVTVRSEGE